MLGATRLQGNTQIIGNLNISSGTLSGNSITDASVN